MSHVFNGVMSQSEAKPQEVTSLPSAASATSSTLAKASSADTKVCDMTQLCGIWLIYVGHVSFMWGMCHVNESCPSSDAKVCEKTHLCGTWIMHHGHESRGVWLVYVGRDSFMWDMTHTHVTWLDMSDSYVTHMTWLIHIWHLWHDSFVFDTWWYVTWLIHMWHTWHDACICDTYDTTHSYVTHHEVCDTTHSYVTCLIHTWHLWNDSTICVTRRFVTRRIHKSHESCICPLTHWCETHRIWLTHTWHGALSMALLYCAFRCPCRWHIYCAFILRIHIVHSYGAFIGIYCAFIWQILRIHMSAQMVYCALISPCRWHIAQMLYCTFICCPWLLYIAHSHGVATISRLLEIIGLFCKQPYQRDYILQKRPIISSSLLIVATPYVHADGSIHNTDERMYTYTFFFPPAHHALMCPRRYVTWLVYMWRDSFIRDEMYCPWIGSLNYMSLLQKSPIKETIFCKRDL